MHLKRQKASTKLPIPRKGTKFIARALSHIDNSVPVVIAVRDMLKLAKNTEEVKKMIQNKLLKINGRFVKDYRHSIKLFNIFEAGKSYFLTILPTRKFAFEETKDKNLRLCKMINKKILKDGIIQLNLHDGSNVISKDKIPVGDSVYLDFEGKIKKHVSLEKGKKIMIITGKYLGLRGNIESLKENKLIISLDDKNKSAELKSWQVVAI